MERLERQGFDDFNQVAGRYSHTNYTGVLEVDHARSHVKFQRG